MLFLGHHRATGAVRPVCALAALMLVSATPAYDPEAEARAGGARLAANGKPDVIKAVGTLKWNTGLARVKGHS